MISSNFYAAKVYSEHPIGLWPLDDDVSFLSLISNNNNRLFSTWTKTGCTANDSPSLPSIASPFDDDTYSALIASVPGSNNTTIEAISPDIFSFDQLNEDLATFSINTYIYQQSTFTNWYEIGYRYYDNTTSSDIDVVQRISAPESPAWINLNVSFNVDEFDTDDAKIIFRVNIDTGGSTGADYTFIMNGLSIGQWSETTCSKSLGAAKVFLPVDTDLDMLAEGVEADQYGPLSENAYYIVDDNRLLAKNEGVPMVIGSDNVTRLYPSVSYSLPSIIFPGKGFLNNTGKYQDYTVEFWMRIKPQAVDDVRIFGPLGSTDGIYVKKGFITLAVGDNIASHNVSEWYRPMLVHILVKNNFVTLLINGEQVAQVPFDPETIELPDSQNYDEYYGPDWLGFYSSYYIDLFEIDCFSIFSYAVPYLVAKKRFVWGQGTGSVEEINAAYEGTTAAVDFSTAEYTANRIYPDIERWDAAYYNNLTATTQYISAPNYELPEIYLSGRNLQQWYSDTSLVNDIEYPFGDHSKFITFRPNIIPGTYSDNWSPFGSNNWTEACYLNFNTINILNSPLAAVYGIFETPENISEQRTLMKFVNSVNGEYFEIYLYEDEVTYVFNGTEIYTEIVDLEYHFAAGIHIPTFSSYYGSTVSTFFASPEIVQLYIGGNGTNTFEGKIYRIGFADQVNYGEISDHFSSDGIIIFNDSALLEEHFASYTLTPIFRYDRFFLDISISASWEEYFPLSYFAKYITDKSGNSRYDLDFLQINLGYPQIIQKEIVPLPSLGWDYYELKESYQYPIQKTYEILNNYFTNYTELNQNVDSTVTATDISDIDASITFQLLAEGADEPINSFIYEKDLTENLVIDAEAENTSINPYKAYYTKFKFATNSVIYPPKAIDFKDVAMVIHLKIIQEGILSNPIKIRNLEISSKALNENIFNKIGTKFGVPLYPYTKTGVYYNGKEKNPIRIDKSNMPYLHLTDNSGIKVLTDKTSSKEYGVYIPVNERMVTDFNVGVVQFFAKYDLFEFPVSARSFFEIRHIGGTLEFLIQSDPTGERGNIICRDKISREIYNDLIFYQNGVQVNTPMIEKNTWNAIGIEFSTPLSFENFTGSMSLFSGVCFDNISYFNLSGLSETIDIIARTWSSVLQDDSISPSNLIWGYWYDKSFGSASPIQWRDVFIVEGTNSFAITPEEIYKTMIGTNINVLDDGAGINLENDQFSIFADVSWLRNSGTPV